jgi:hypothetical protein
VEREVMVEVADGLPGREQILGHLHAGLVEEGPELEQVDGVELQCGERGRRVDRLALDFESQIVGQALDEHTQAGHHGSTGTM